MGWGTWTSGGRTHILAFTSSPAMSACMADRGGSARRVPYSELAAGWPNDEWWLAINPGLPIEGYLPAWFVAQLARGDVRLPGRTLRARARVEAAAAAPLPVRTRDQPPAAFFATGDPAARPAPPARPTVIEGAVVDAPAQDRWSALREPLPPEPVPSVPPPERRSAPDPSSERRATMPAPESRPEFRPVSDRWPEPRAMPSEPRSMPEARPGADSRPDFGSAPETWPGAHPRGGEP